MKKSDPIKSFVKWHNELHTKSDLLTTEDEVRTAITQGIFGNKGNYTLEGLKDKRQKFIEWKAGGAIIKRIAKKAKLTSKLERYVNQLFTLAEMPGESVGSLLPPLDHKKIIRERILPKVLTCPIFSSDRFGTLTIKNPTSSSRKVKCKNLTKLVVELSYSIHVTFASIPRRFIPAMITHVRRSLVPLLYHPFKSYTDLSDNGILLNIAHIIKHFNIEEGEPVDIYQRIKKDLSRTL